MAVNGGRFSRREVLAGAAAAGGLGLLPAWVRSAAAPSSPNGKANIAFIGIGNYGAQNLQELAGENVVALCDVDWRTRAENPGHYTPAVEVASRYPGVKRFDDWRVMLDEMDRQIDAVVVCTADHVHAVAALTAMQMGKHVYCEKPLAATVGEVRAMMESARQHPKQATQAGIVGHASEDVRTMVEWIRAGAIGDVERVDVFQSNWQAGQRYMSPYPELAHMRDAVPTPPEVKWDLFLGPAADRPYEPMYLPLRWRNWQAFGTGILGDHGPHFLDPVVWALNLDWPETVEADTDSAYTAAVRQQMYPRTSHVNYRFPSRGKRSAVTVKWWGYDTPPTPAGWPKDKPLPTGGGIFHGTKGILLYGPVYSSRPGPLKQVYLLPEDLDRGYRRPEPTLTRPANHWTEWIEAAKSGTQPSCNWQYGGHITELCLLGNIAIQHAGTTLHFDGKSGQFTNSDAANAAFRREARSGWELPVPHSQLTSVAPEGAHSALYEAKSHA